MNKPCSFCDNPLHEIAVGVKQVKLWVHRGKELETCKAIKLDRKVIADLMQVFQRIQKDGKVKIERKEDGEVVIFGETRT